MLNLNSHNQWKTQKRTSGTVKKIWDDLGRKVLLCQMNFCCRKVLYKQQLQLNQSRIHLHSKVSGCPIPGPQQIPSTDDSLSSPQLTQCPSREVSMGQSIILHCIFKTIQGWTLPGQFNSLHLFHSKWVCFFFEGFSVLWFKFHWNLSFSATTSMCYT